MPGIGVITNPWSQKNRMDPQISQRLRSMVGRGNRVAVPHDMEDLRGTAADFRDRGIEIVAINGGDGTVHRVVGALLRAYQDKPLPMIALLCGGTLNTVAAGLGVRGTPESLLARLMHRYRTGVPIPTVTRGVLAVDEQVGFVFGNGVLAHFLQLYYALPGQAGPRKALWLLLRSMLSTIVDGQLARDLWQPMLGRVSADGQRWPELPWLSLAAGTVDDISFRFRPFYKAPSHPGYIHAMGIGCTPVEMLLQLPRIWCASPTNHPNILNAVARELVIDTDHPIVYTLDGDLYQGGQRLIVRAGPLVQLAV